MKIEPTPRGVLATFFRQKFKFLFMFLLVLAGVAAYLHLATPYYQSHGTLLIRFGSNAHPDMGKPGSPTETVSEVEERNLIAGDIQIIGSHDLLLPLVQEFGAERLYPGLVDKSGSVRNAEEVAVGKLMSKDLVVKPDPTSTVIAVQVFNRDPKLAQAFLRRLMEVFTVRQSQVYDDPQINFLDEQVRQASDRLMTRQQELAAFKSKSGLTSIEGELSQLLEEKTDAKNAALQNLTEAQTTLDELRSKQADLSSNYRQDSFAIRKYRDSMAIAERRLRERQADLKSATNMMNVPDPVPVEGAAPQPQTEAENAGPLTAHIAGINRRIAALESQRTGYNDLTRAVQIAELDYKNYQSHLEQARISQTMKQQNITRVSVLDQPQLPGAPTRPNKVLVALLGLVTAMLLALGAVIASESLDDRFTNPEQVSHALRLPVMATFGKARRA